MTAFNPQVNGGNQQDSHLANLAQGAFIPWLSNPIAAQQQTVNQQSPYGPSSNQYIINSNQDSYLQQLQNYHQSPAALPSLLGQTPYWPGLSTALVFPAPPPQAMMAQQPQGSNNDEHSPQSKHMLNNNDRPLTPSGSGDILSTSQPNQQPPQYMNMPRAGQTPGRISRP